MDAVAIDSLMPDDEGTEPDLERPRLRLPYKRILIYGVTGSGKTTTAKRLGDLTGIPWTEVDTLTWDPGWTEVPLEVQRERIQAICDQEEWILDSAYGKWLDIPLERVELVIGLDYPRVRSLRQLIWRTVSRAITKEKVCNGNVESFKGLFSKESLVIWHFKSFARKRERIHHWATEGKFDVKAFNHPSDLDQWIFDVASSEILKEEFEDNPPRNELDVIEALMKHEDRLP